MNYNFHPIIVHFPIACLFFYSIIIIFPFDRWFKKINWIHIRLFLIVVGVVSAWMAGATGETAEHLVKVNRDVLNAHSFFAGATNAFYVLLLAGELLPYVSFWAYKIFNNFYIDRLLGILQRILSNHFVMFILAVLGFIAIFMTGLLGGVMVHGTTADPLAAPVLKMLGITL